MARGNEVEATRQRLRATRHKLQHGAACLPSMPSATVFASSSPTPLYSLRLDAGSPHSQGTDSDTSLGTETDISFGHDMETGWAPDTPYSFRAHSFYSCRADSFNDRWADLGDCDSLLAPTATI